jgi:lipoprotein signal peptidase
MVIKIPNGLRFMTLYLQDVLYSPEISFTLVSLSRADKAGYSTLIKGGMMNIVDRTQKKTIGQILSVRGIWQIEDQSSTIDLAAFTAISLTNLH